MFNLKFSKRDDLNSKRRTIITSRNTWTINGKVVNSKENKKGFWLTVRTDAKVPLLYSLNNLELDCFLPKATAMTAYKKESYLHRLHAYGKFVFKKDECYFLVERLLI